LLEHLEGEAVVDLREVDVRGTHAGRRERPRRGRREPDPEDVLAAHDLVGGAGLPGCGAEDADRLPGEIARAFRGGDDDRRAAVGFEAAIEQAIGSAIIGDAR
jgi:hypothetical protein